MVTSTTPNYQIVVNGTDKTDTIKRHFISLSVTDNDKEKADEITLTVSKKFARPAYRDRIQLYLGYDHTLTFVGLFFVQKTTIRNNRLLIISATSLDFNAGLKERRHIHYDDMTLSQLAKTIADRHHLAVKTNMDNQQFHFQQMNESDLNLLNKLAKAHDALFNIKNGTLYFIKKGSEVVPQVTIDINRCSNSDITHSNKTLYKSCKAIYHNTKLNKVIEIIAGQGKPELVKQGHFHNDNQARIFAENALLRANKGLAQGTLTTAGQVLFAGSKLTLDNTVYDINKVQHSVTHTGWTTSLEFNTFQMPP